jgi:hypothetical protein
MQVGQNLETIRNDLSNNYGRHITTAELQNIVEILKHQNPFGGKMKLCLQILKWASPTIFYTINFFM